MGILPKDVSNRGDNHDRCSHLKELNQQHSLHVRTVMADAPEEGKDEAQERAHVPVQDSKEPRFLHTFLVPFGRVIAGEGGPPPSPRTQRTLDPIHGLTKGKMSDYSKIIRLFEAVSEKASCWTLWAEDPNKHPSNRLVTAM